MIYVDESTVKIHNTLAKDCMGIGMGMKKFLSRTILNVTHTVNKGQPENEGSSDVNDPS